MSTTDILICTPLALEYDAVLRHLSNIEEDHSFANLRCKRGTFENKDGQQIQIAVVETEPSIAKVSTATSKAVAKFNPSVAILTGIAGGVKDCRIGDIVVGTEAYGYEHGKEADTGFASRPNVLPYDPSLIKLARNIAEEGTWKKRAGYGAQGSRVFFGPIASGDKVIASHKTELYEMLKKHYNNTLAVEMEAIGFARALHGEPVKAINIRGISDLLAGKAEADARGNQELVVQYAAGFVMELVYEMDNDFFNETNDEMGEGKNPDFLEKINEIEKTINQEGIKEDNFLGLADRMIDYTKLHEGKEEYDQLRNRLIMMKGDFHDAYDGFKWRRLREKLLSEWAKLGALSESEKKNDAIPVKTPTKTLDLFIVYAHEDIAYKESLKDRLREMADTINAIHDGQILAGDDWDKWLKDKLSKSDVMLLLVSQHFLESEYINKVEFPAAIVGHETGKKRVIPIIISECNWQKTWINKLQVLPKNRTLQEYASLNEGLEEILLAIKSVI